MGIGLSVFNAELVGANTKISFNVWLLIFSQRSIRIIVKHSRCRTVFTYTDWTTEFV